MPNLDNVTLSPSWSDLWFFLTYIGLAILYRKAYKYFFRKNEDSLFGIAFWIAYIMIFVSVLPSYVIFLMLKPCGIIKTLIPIVIFSVTFPFGVLAGACIHPVVAFWNNITKKERVFGILIGIVGLVILVLAMMSFSWINKCAT